jgi:hypothetical protein
LLLGELLKSGDMGLSGCEKDASLLLHGPDSLLDWALITGEYWAKELSFRCEPEPCCRAFPLPKFGLGSPLILDAG